jgi:cystathionine beta-lyase
MAPVEGTYLAWLDLRDTGRDRWIEAFEAGGVGLYDGADFGTPGFLRLNFACPTALLVDALDRMDRVIRG